MADEKPKRYLEPNSAEPLTRRQLAKVFGGIIQTGAHRVGVGVARAVWVAFYEAAGGNEVKFEQPPAPADEQQRLAAREFAAYVGAVAGACEGFCNSDDVLAAMAFYAEQEEIWQLLEKGKN